MKHLLAACLLLAGLRLAGAGFSVELEAVRPSVRVGEYIQLALSSPRQITSIDYPVVKGARWAENIQYSQTRSINGKVNYIRVLALAPEKMGVLLIPSFTVRSFCAALSSFRSGSSSSTSRIRLAEAMAREENISRNVTITREDRIWIT